MSKIKTSILVPFLIIFSLVFIYFYPRFLIAELGEANPWTSFLYLYGFGGLFFAVGLLLITRSGACVFGRGQDSKWFTILCTGFITLMSVHAIWIYLAISIPVKSGVN